jgi:hypothetical protein
MSLPISLSGTEMWMYTICRRRKRKKKSSTHGGIEKRRNKCACVYDEEIKKESEKEREQGSE